MAFCYNSIENDRANKNKAKDGAGIWELLSLGIYLLGRLDFQCPFMLSGLTYLTNPKIKCSF